MSYSIARKNELFTLNTSIFQENKLVFHWKDLTFPAQILHPAQARFKLSTPKHRRQSISRKCLGWEGGMLKLRVDRRVTPASQNKTRLWERTKWLFVSSFRGMRCRLCTLREDWGSREAINIIIFTIHTPIILVRKICHPFSTFSQWSTVKEVFSSPISRLTYSYSLTDRRTNEQTDGRTKGPTDGPTGQTEGRTDRRTDRQMDILLEIEVDKSSVTWQNVIQELV